MIFSPIFEEICTSSLPIIDEFLQSVLSVSSGSDSTGALVSWLDLGLSLFVWWDNILNAIKKAY